MNSFSNVTLVGRLTRDAEMRTSSSGVAVVRFAVAIDRRRRDGDNFVTDTTFIEVSYFGQSAKNICMYLEKGLLVGVVGELNQRKWESQDGAKNSRIEVLANNVHLIESKSMKENRLQGGSQSDQYSQGGSAYSDAGRQPSASNSGIKQYVPDENIGPDSFNDDDVPF